MDIRKPALCLAACFSIFSATPSFAEGTQYLPQDVCQENGIYIDGMLGYVQTNWKSTLGGVTGSDTSGTGITPLTWDRGNGSFGGGGDIGYQFNRYIGMEFGGFGWQGWRVTGANPNPALPNLTSKGSSYVLYLAAKLTVPLFNFDNFDIYGKAGIGFQHLSYSGTFTTLDFPVVGGATHTGPMFAIGGEYWITNHWYASLQLARFAGTDQNLAAYRTVPGVKLITSPNIITFGMGYFFNL